MRFIFSFLILFLVANCVYAQVPPCTGKRFILTVHGGVGYKPSQAQNELLEKILRDGHLQLKAGKSGQDVVQIAIEQMEDSGIFNAGKGGTRTSAGTVELDASIMDGATLMAGAVASVKDVKNPIRLARYVKDNTKHVLMVGPGASRLADEARLEKVDAAYFTSEMPKAIKPEQHGTVGAVALDRCGHLTAGTSTGGLFGKRPGRVGDSPIIGAGTYANDQTVGVSATGEGEKFIRASVAVRISNILQYTGRTLQSAIDESLKLVVKLGGSGGLIAISQTGRVSLSTSGGEPMPSGYIREDGVLFMREKTK